MQISPINYKVNSSFGNNNEKEKIVTEPKKSKIPETFNRKQVGGAVLATALSAAVIGGALVHGKARLAVRRAASENEALSRRIQELVEGNNNIQRGFEDTKDRFGELLEGDLSPKELRDKIYSTLREKIFGGNLDYDISTPPVTGKTGGRVFDDAIELPAYVGTNNRAGMTPLRIPEIGSDGSFEFKLPNTSEIKISKAKTKDFTPIPYTLTTISESYADSVRWDNNKIARDILQNFFDGHGQTLDGVRFSFVPVGNGKYKVRISGDSSYTADKALILGESTKRNDARAAGNYGEGLKMSALKLLKDSGADNVKFASDNWELSYSLGKGDLSDSRLLGFSIDKVTPIEGNYIEFETSDKNLLETFRTSINRFYHSGNEHFKCPDFENDLVGIKLLQPGQKGGIYVAGQRFEFDNNYDGLEDAVIFLKEKPAVSNFDPSRDRTSMDIYDFMRISSWLSDESRMSQDDKVKMLKALDKFWGAKGLGKHPLDYFVEYFASALERSNIHIKFPSNYIAYSPATEELVLDLQLKGYRICKEEFADLGMPTIKELMGDARAHEVVVPNEKETKKIMILKEAIQVLSRSLKDKHFTEDELNTKIFLFNNKSEKDKKLYNDTLAEAITEAGFSRGFWIDKEYLNTANFSDVLETALHELSHKAGGDESSTFSYKLTNVNRDVIKQLINDIQSRNEIQALNKLWVELGS